MNNNINNPETKSNIDTKKLNDQEQIRHKKLEQLIANNQNPYLLEKLKPTNTLKEVVAEYTTNYDRESILEVKKTFTLVGRVMAIRQTFLVIKQEFTKLQLYINKKNVSEDLLNYFKNYLDLGDLIEVSGTLFFTKMNELTLNVNDLKIVSKCLHVLPEKHHGLKDIEQKLRKRYLDSIVNDEILEVFQTRSKIIKIIRNYLDSLGYLEVETPILHQTLGGAAARPFITHHNTLGEEFYLRIATELPLKKMIVAGFDKIYEIGRCFRNEGMDATHNPEFTSLEMYTAFDGLDETIDICQKIFSQISKELKVDKVVWNEHEIFLNKPFKKVKMSDLVKEKTGIDFYHDQPSLEQALKLANQYHLELKEHEKTVGHIFNKLFEELCEAELIQPTFVYGHHKDVSPLAKADPKNRDFTLRFELFIGTKEFANGFAELNDPIDQLKRFEDQVKESKMGNDEANEIDYDFVDALEYGLVPTGGLGIGIDRLIMMFTQQNTIRNVIFFPHMKKEK